MNKFLYHSNNGQVELPEEIINNLKNCYHNVAKIYGDIDKTDEGYKRNQELQTQKFINYKQLKRIKNFFDSYHGSQDDPSYIMNGGVIMKNWVDNELRRMRENIDSTKKHKEETGMENQFISTHTKDGLDSIRPSKQHLKTVDKYNVQVTESLKRINEIMKKI